MIVKLIFIITLVITIAQSSSVKGDIRVSNDPNLSPGSTVDGTFEANDVTGVVKMTYEDIDLVEWTDFSNGVFYQSCGGSVECSALAEGRVFPRIFIETGDINTYIPVAVSGRICYRWDKGNVNGGVVEIYYDDSRRICRIIFDDGTVYSFLSLGTATNVVLPTCTPADECTGVIDIVLAVQVSDLNTTELADTKEYLSNLVASFDVNSVGANFAVVFFSEGMINSLPFSDDSSDILSFINSYKIGDGSPVQDPGSGSSLFPNALRQSAPKYVIQISRETNELSAVEESDIASLSILISENSINTESFIETPISMVRSIVCEVVLGPSDCLDCDGVCACGECNCPDCAQDTDICTNLICTDAGSCAFEPVCNDGNLCTSDLCNSNGVCDYIPVECDDGDLCTVGHCQESDGACVFTPLDCDDGNKCTIDTCHNGTCIHTPKECEGGNADGCSSGVCDEATGDCTVVHVKCNTSDACVVGQCISGECVYNDIDCTHGDLCINGKCDAGECVYEPVACDDGNKCTVDTCNSATGNCVFTKRDCSSADPCIIGECQSTDGTCVYEPVCADSCIKELVDTPYFSSPLQKARYSDYNVIVFGDFFTRAGLIGGRLIAQGDIKLEGWLRNKFSIGSQTRTSGPDSVDSTVPYAVVAGGTVQLSGTVLPSGGCKKRGDAKENILAGRKCDVGKSLRKRCTEKKFDATAVFAEAQTYYKDLANSFASVTPNTYYEKRLFCLFIKSDEPNAHRYYVHIDSRDFSQYICLQTEGINNDAQFIITLTGDRNKINFMGAKAPSLSSRTVFVVQGKKQLFTSASVTGNILAPESSLQQSAGIQKGMVIVQSINNIVTGISKMDECSFKHPHTSEKSMIIE